MSGVDRNKFEEKFNDFAEEVEEKWEQYKKRKYPDGFDPSIFNDPLAMKTEWLPLHEKGTGFKTHSLFISEDRAIFLPSLQQLAFGSVFIIAGAVGLYFSLGNEDSTSILFMTLWLICSCLVFIFLLKPIRFSKKDDLFYTLFFKSNYDIVKPYGRNQFPLSEIGALQIVEELCRTQSDKGTSKWYSYELNIVRKDGVRANILDHSNYNALMEQAHKLANFLDVPLWNAS